MWKSNTENQNPLFQCFHSPNEYCFRNSGNNTHFVILKRHGSQDYSLKSSQFCGHVSAGGSQFFLTNPSFISICQGSHEQMWILEGSFFPPVCLIFTTLCVWRLGGRDRTPSVYKVSTKCTYTCDPSQTCRLSEQVLTGPNESGT